MYDSDGRLTQENHEDKNGEISNCITYAHDHAGRRLTVTAPDGTLTENNAYDAHGRLVREIKTERDFHMTIQEGARQ